MVAIKALSVLALAGAAIAVPVAQPNQVGTALVARDAEADAQGPWQGARANYSWRYGWGRPQGQSSEEQPTETEQPTTSQPQPEQGQGQGQSQPEQPASSPSTPAAAPSGGSSSGGATSGGYMGIVQEWRSKMGLPALTEDSTLSSNAMDTSVSSGGQLKHKLNPGSMAQVMAPGNSGNFESVFVGGWLCELPSLPGLGSSVCNSASQGWDHAGQTGHAEILSSTKYSKIGCGNADNMWTCDLA